MMRKTAAQPTMTDKHNPHWETDTGKPVQAELPLVPIDVTSNTNREFARANALLEAAYYLPIDAARLLECTLNFVAGSPCLDGMPPVHQLRHDDLRQAVPAWNKSGSLAKRIRDAADALWNAQFGIVSDDLSSVTRYRWLGAETRHKSGLIEIQLNAAVLPYVKELKAHYGKFKLRDQLEFTTNNNKRIFDIIVARQYKRKFHIGNDELAVRLDIPKRESAQMRTRVLEPAIDQINELTQYHVVIEEPVKRGRRVIGWMISVENGSRPLLNDQRASDVKEKLSALKIHRGTRDRLLGKYHDSYLRAKLAELATIQQERTIDNPAGLFVRLLEEDIQKTPPQPEFEQKTIEYVVAQSQQQRNRLKRLWQVQKAKECYRASSKADRLEINRTFLARRGLALEPDAISPEKVPVQHRDEYNAHLLVTFQQMVPEPTASDLDQFAQQHGM